MKLNIEIRCDNAAFDSDGAEEVARILHGLAADIAMGYIAPGETGRLYDVNGNPVGGYQVHP